MAVSQFSSRRRGWTPAKPEPRLLFLFRKSSGLPRPRIRCAMHRCIECVKYVARSFTIVSQDGITAAREKLDAIPFPFTAYRDVFASCAPTASLQAHWGSLPPENSAADVARSRATALLARLDALIAPVVTRVEADFAAGDADVWTTLTLGGLSRVRFPTSRHLEQTSRACSDSVGAFTVLGRVRSWACRL